MKGEIVGESPQNLERELHPGAVGRWKGPQRGVEIRPDVVADACLVRNVLKGAKDRTKVLRGCVMVMT
jgi:hypothetical protein